MRRTLRFLVSLVSANLKASVSLRGAFLLQAAFMAANNLIFWCVWWLFFRNYPEIRGWRLGDLTALYGINALCYGLAFAFGGGSRNLARLIADGQIDAFLTQPKPLLPHLVGSGSFASCWGDLASGALLVAASGYLTGPKALLIALFAVSGAVLFLSSAIVVGSLAFWLGPMETLARQLMEWVILFTVYPQNIYGGFLKVLMFTVIPAGLIGHLPVETLRDFSWLKVLGVLGGTVLYSAAASAFFSLGLRRYESGNRVALHV